MTYQRKKALWQIGAGVILLVVALAAYWQKKEEPTVMNFAECAKAGYPIMESYPRQCRTSNEQTFKEDIGNELEKDNLIRIETPRPNAVIKSPLTIKGVARGYWFFEASFPIKLLDGNGKEVAHAIAQAKADPIRDDGASPVSNRVNWMTAEFVPFEATLQFEKPVGKAGTLVFKKDNPSDLRENDDSLMIPIVFKN